MQHREEWKRADEDGMLARLRQAIAAKPVDWTEISDILWWARRRDGEGGGDVMLRYVDYLGHHLRKHAAGGGGWYAGERKIWTFGGVEFAMRWIPAGRFLMGAGEDDMEASKGEKPQHEVAITQGFWMGETPVTQGQYQAIMGENPSYFQYAGLDAPVESVSWYDAAAFTNQLSEMEGLSACFVGTGEEMKGVGSKRSDYIGCKGWRLPTEAEWEYACRAGTTTPRYGALDDVAWWGAWAGDGNAEVSYDEAFEKRGKKWGTHPVRQKQANAWGLHDVLGNVLEWCYEVYSLYEELATREPLHTDGGTKRVSRGGCWYYEARFVRSALRVKYASSLRNDIFGFRLIRS